MDLNVSVQQQHQSEPMLRKVSKNGTSSCSASSDDSDIEPDLVSTINYNTESSINVLREVMNNQSSDADYEGSFFHRYFQNHSNSLPSRIAVAARRLSQCREEDEDEERKEPVPLRNTSTISDSDKSLSESSNSSKTSVIDTISGPTHKFVITKTKQPSEAAKIFASRKQYRQANTVHAIPPQIDTSRPSLYSIFKSNTPHYDSRFFDSSLIEMKSQTSSTSTLDCNSSVEDIWVKRQPDDAKKVSIECISKCFFFVDINNNIFLKQSI